MRAQLHLFIITLTYVLIAVCGFLVSIPMAVTKANFGGYCVLFMDINWENQNHFIAEFGDGASCDFATYLPVIACIVYGLLMAIYNGFHLVKQSTNSSLAAKDDATVVSVWAVPCLLLNLLVTVFVFICACVLSTGMSHTCAQLLAGGNPQYEGYVVPVPTRSQQPRCSDFQENMEWTNPVGDKINTTTFYRNVLVAQVSAWLCTALWVLVVVWTAVRLVRNGGRKYGVRSHRHRHRCGEMISISTSSSQEKTNIADVSPTA